MALDKWSSLYTELVSNAPICIHEISRDGRVLAINPAGLRMMGAEAECEVVGTSFLDGVTEPRRAEVGKIIEQSFSGQPAELESEFVTARGTRLFSLKVVPLGGENGEVERLLCFVRDITGIRRSEQELIRTAERLQEAQQVALIGNWERDFPDGDIWASDQLYRMIGRKRDLFAPTVEAFSALVLPEERERIYQAFKSAAKTGETVEIEHRIRAAGGEIKWVYSRGRFEKGQDGRPIRAMGTVQDITARKREEQALRESEERLRLAQSAAGIGTWDMNVLSGEGTWSDNYWGIYGIPPGGCVPGYKAWLELVYPGDRDRVDAEIKAALEGTAPYASEFRIVWPNGAVRWLAGKGTVIRDDSGRAVRMTGVDYDITERKAVEKALKETQAALEVRVRARTKELLQANAALTAEIYTRKRAEETLRRNEERFNLAVLGSRDGIWDWPDVNRDEQWWSPRTYEFLGYQEGAIEASQTSFLELLHPDDRERVAGNIQRHLYGGPAIDDEYRIKTASGEFRWFHARGQAVFDVAGKPTRMAGAITDITDRKRAEQERIALEARVLHAQKLESLGVLAGGIAHDFNNLLVGVLGNADLALMEMDGNSSAAEHLDMIVTAAKRASELTKQMLAYSGKGKFVVEHVDLSQLVEEMARLMSISISKKVKLHREFGENVPPVEADASQLRQVVMNLITNASEAVGDANGSITIRTGVAEAGHRFHDAASGYTRTIEAPHVYIEVCDTGCGMDKQTESKLFEPFFTTKFTGRGLGLAAVLGIVRGHSGGIHVRSKPGAGSTFRVLFPASPAEARRRAPALGSERNWHGEGLVLVVDDEDTVREMGERMLARMGFEVITACDGGEAMNIIEERGSSIRLVLLDLTMPYLDGKETLREIRQLHPGTKVIMTSGYNEPEVSNRFEGYEVAGFLQKPYRYAELADSVRMALSANPDESPLPHTA